jgi:hypothetical protein
MKTMKPNQLAFALTALLAAPAFAEDSIVCEDHGTLNVVLIAEDYTVDVQDYREETRYELQSILAKLEGERYYRVVEDEEVLEKAVQNLRLQFDNGTSVKEVIFMRDLDRLGDGDEFEAQVYQEFPGGRSRKVRSIACYYAQS